MFCFLWFNFFFNLWKTHISLQSHDPFTSIQIEKSSFISSDLAKYWLFKVVKQSYFTEYSNRNGLKPRFSLLFKGFSHQQIYSMAINLERLFDCKNKPGVQHRFLSLWCAGPVLMRISLASFVIQSILALRWSRNDVFRLICRQFLLLKAQKKAELCN